MHPPLNRDNWTGLLPTLPLGVRVMLTAFLAIIAAGYLTAVVNIYFSHSQTDGKDGLSIDDLRAAYSGLSIVRSKDTLIPSRMLTMIRGQMRQYVDNDQDFQILENWLKTGGTREDFTAGPRKKTPRRAMIRHCLRCHAKSTATEISKKSPFGEDEFSPNYALFAKFVAPAAESSDKTVRLPPQYTLQRLVLISHIHMLAIPLFTLIVGLLFMLTRLPLKWRSALVSLPMLAVLMDFSGWWLARIADPFVYMILTAGGLFGLIFGAQILIIAIDLWKPPAHNEPAHKIRDRLIPPNKT